MGLATAMRFAADGAKEVIAARPLIPGATRPRIWSSRAPTPEAMALAKASSRAIPLGRFGRPDEIASAALVLASNNASTATGLVNGGIIRTPPFGPVFRR